MVASQMDFELDALPADMDASCVPMPAVCEGSGRGSSASLERERGNASPLIQLGRTKSGESSKVIFGVEDD